MIFIKNTKIKKAYNSNVMHAIFLCKYCHNIFEKPKYLGERNKSCISCSNKIKSIRNKTHNESGNKIRLYRIWRGMKARCNCPSKKETKYYKDKNITVCVEWKNNYVEFKKWALNNNYKDNLTIDRIDNNKGYSPNNCRWITLKEQSHNRSNNVLNWITVNLIRELYKLDYTKKELFEIFDISKRNLNRIINNKRWKENEVLI